MFGDLLSLSELREIPDRHQSTLGGVQFVLYDSFKEDDGDENNRVIVFSTRRNIKILFKYIMWFLDGTFETAPHIFTQIFTILGLVVRSAAFTGDPYTAVALSLVYALLPSKTEAHYTLVLH
ncbi:uncharacterized protein LOC127751301 [Frankliniella occidentalis]|uniref:Uncharacterized protein LOC127751301 n=1 Tax=Frankliniella occidentalis TaxID=133901 RepID=A0A9C6X7C1_FRAOC|nr:uncharacterized protein LOC127751301 [Frankliniella occidentalis]